MRQTLRKTKLWTLHRRALEGDSRPDLGSTLVDFPFKAIKVNSQSENSQKNGKSQICEIRAIRVKKMAIGCWLLAFSPTFSLSDPQRFHPSPPARDP